MSDIPAIHIYIKRTKNIQLRDLEIACYLEYYALIFFYLRLLKIF